MPEEKTKTQTVPIKECVPNWWNPNEMNARQFSSLKKALTKYGQTKPIQVGIWENMGYEVGEGKKKRWVKVTGYVIVGGYHTWKVLSDLGKSEIEVNIHDFKDEDEAKLYGLTDNIHGSNQQIKLGKLAYELTQKGYSIKDIAGSIGAEDVDVKDALDLVKDDIEKKMAELKKAERENFVALNFIVDKDPKVSADDFLEAVTAFAKTKGVKIGKISKDINPQRETIALVSFNVTAPQKTIIDEALSALNAENKLNEAEGLTELCGRFLKSLFQDIKNEPTPSSKLKKNRKR